MQSKTFSKSEPNKITKCQSRDDVTLSSVMSDNCSQPAPFGEYDYVRSPLQRQRADMPITHISPPQQYAIKRNNTGLPDSLKMGIESLSGMNMDGVKVHYNSSRPAQLQALAYAQGRNIHLAPGQEQHLPHEAWHVVQQAQGRVKPTMQMKGGVVLNDSTVLEAEADVMGARAAAIYKSGSQEKSTAVNHSDETAITSAAIAIQRKVTEPVLCSGAVVQRVVDLTVNTQATQNNHYFIKTDARQVLYSLTNVPAPRPEALYEKKNDQSTAGLALYKWVPNIRLFSNAERARIEDENDDTSALMQGLDHGVKNPLMAVDTVSLPSKAVLGKNDCKGLGGTLSAMISQEDVDNTAVADDTMEVGDRMTHNFPVDAECDYHSATVVAKDAVSLVTLEADVSKDRSRPEFYIRNGVAGFVQDNNLADDGGDNNYGDNVSITRAKGKAASDQDIQILRQVHSHFAEYRDAYYMLMHPNPGITDTQQLLNAKAASLAKIRQIANKYWGKYTSWKFTPAGVDAIREILKTVPANSDSDAITDALGRIKLRATGDLGRASANRKQLTTDFYAALSGMDIQSPDSLGAVVLTLNGLIGRMDAKQD